MVVEIVEQKRGNKVINFRKNRRKGCDRLAAEIRALGFEVTEDWGQDLEPLEMPDIQKIA